MQFINAYDAMSPVSIKDQTSNPLQADDDEELHKETR
jgi:hypothetical protein